MVVNPYLAAAAHQRQDMARDRDETYLDNHPETNSIPCIRDAANLFYIFSD